TIPSMNSSCPRSWSPWPGRNSRSPRRREPAMAASVHTVDGRQSSARRRRGSTTRSSGGTTLEYLLTAPAIYSLIVPLVLLDLWASFYQHACFRVYGIARVRRADYFVVDRERLPYLNALEKAN